MPGGSRLHVVHLVGDFAGENLLDLLAAFDRDRFRVTLATLGELDPARRARLGREGIGVLVLGAQSRRDYPVAAIRLFRALRRLRADLVHTHLFDASVLGMITARLARVPARVLTRHHTDFHHRIGRPLHVQLDRLCTRLSDRVIAVSSATRDVLVDREDAPPGKVRIVHNGIDLERYRPQPEAVRAVRRELELGSSPVVSMVARFHPVKGHRHLVSALPAVVRAVPDVAVLLVGTGPGRPQVEGWVRDAGLSTMVRFLGYRDDVAAVMATSDVVVVPSLAESFGQVALEAMAVGVPVVASRVGGLPELVSDGETGLLVPRADPGALAEAITALLDDPDRRRRLGDAGRQWAQAFDVSATARAYEDVYDETLRQAET